MRVINLLVAQPPTQKACNRAELGAAQPASPAQHQNKCAKKWVEQNPPRSPPRIVPQNGRLDARLVRLEATGYLSPITNEIFPTLFASSLPPNVCAVLYYLVLLLITWDKADIADKYLI